MGLIRNWRRRRTLSRASVDAAQWQRVEHGLPFLARLSDEERQRLREMAILFLSEKQMHGAADLDLDDDIRLSIALQACLPVLNLGLDYYDGWVGIIVYPGEFRVQREEVDEDGVVHAWDDELSGEAWPGGPVLLSWEDVRIGTTAPEEGGEPGYNVVIHEFAHKIDMLHKGDADGLPMPHDDMDAERWYRALEEGYEHFLTAVDRGEEKMRSDDDELVALDERDRELPFDPYAAEHPAEFFAVMSEEFFTDPLTLRDWYPELYRELTRFYRQDPAARLASDR